MGLIGLLLMAALSAAQSGEAAPPFRVVVHRANPVASISRAELSAIYMKRKRSWAGGGEIVAIDQSPASGVRERFSRAVHGKSVAYVTRYWQRLIFSGRGVPPRQVPSDAAVLALVRSNPRAIGYVRGDVTPGEGVKTIAVLP